MSRPKTLDAGRFNRQLTIENEVEVVDGLGGFSISYQATGTAWAHICPVSNGLKSQADNQISEVTHKIFVRFRSDISPTSCFVSGARRFEVEALHDPDETRRYLECHVVERK